LHVTAKVLLERNLRWQQCFRLAEATARQFTGAKAQRNARPERPAAAQEMP
jgi:hypothetical protein